MIKTQNMLLLQHLILYLLILMIKDTTITWKFVNIILAVLFIQLIFSCSWKAKKTIVKQRHAYFLEAKLTGPSVIGNIHNNVFNDEYIEGRFQLLPNLIHMDILNKHSDTLFILWNECELGFPGGSRSKIVHSALDYDDRMKPLKYTPMPPGKVFTYFIAPKTRIDWNAIMRKWRSFPLMEGNPTKYLNKNIIFWLRLYHTKGTAEYPFVFTINKIDKYKLPYMLPETYERPLPQPYINVLPEVITRDTLPEIKPVNPGADFVVEDISPPDSSEISNTTDTILAKEPIVQAQPLAQDTQTVPTETRLEVKTDSLESKQSLIIPEDTLVTKVSIPEPVKVQKPKESIQALLNKLNTMKEQADYYQEEEDTIIVYEDEEGEEGSKESVAKDTLADRNVSSPATLSEKKSAPEDSLLADIPPPPKKLQAEIEPKDTLSDQKVKNLLKNFQRSSSPKKSRGVRRNLGSL